VKMHRRLQRLEQKVPDPGCLACGDRRGRIVMVETDRQADGSVVLQDQEPEACGLCGVVPEFVVTVILSFVGEPNRP
jgi:hypothetical protein